MEEKNRFVLNLGKERSVLSLWLEGEKGAEREWPESRDMGRRLFEALQSLLEEKGLSPKDVPGFVLESDQDVLESSTSLRIAETVQKVYTFSVSRLPSSTIKEEEA